MPDIFLSYSREDQPTARRFAEAFEREGLSVWWDQVLNPGETFDKVTEQALEQAKAVVVLWSKTSVASNWVRAEAMQAFERGNLVPAMIEACKRPIMFELTHTVDLSRWRGDPDDATWQTFLAGVRRFAGDTAYVPARPRSSKRSRRISGPWIAMIATAAVLAVVAGLWALYHGSAQQLAPSVPGPAATAEVTLAVLPFADLSPARDQEYFSDGLAEEILNQLTQVKGLAVTARTSSFSFKGKNEDVRGIGEKLGVANLLEGSVRKDGAQVRITAQLVSSTDGAHIWSQTYDRELSKVFTLQEEIAKDVARALSIKLDVGEMSRARGGTTNLEAYDHYLQAMALSNQDAQRDNQIRSVQLLRETVALDPTFTMAWAALAEELQVLALWTPGNDAALARELADAQEQVLSLAPEGLFAQGVHWQRLMEAHQWSEADAVTAAIARTPDGDAFQAAFLVAVGRFRDALVHLERLRQRDPLSLFWSTNLQVAYEAVGRVAEARAENERGRALAGDHSRAEFFAMWGHMLRADLDRATFLKRFGPALDPQNLPLEIDSGLAGMLDDGPAARAVIRKAFANPANQEALRMSLIAIFASMFDDQELTLAALRRGLIVYNGFIADINVWLPYGADFRTDRRFKALLSDLGLIDYFRASGNWGDFCKPVGDDFECR